MGRLVRLAVLLGVAAGTLALLTDDPGIQVIAPLMVALLCVQVYPLARPGRLDLFEPPVLAGVQAAFATVSTVAAFSENGSLSLKWLENLSTESTIELVATVTGASILGLVCSYIGYYHPRWGVAVSRVLPDVSRPSWSRWRLAVTIGGLSAIFVVTYAVFQGRLGVSLADPTQLVAGKAVWRDDPTSSWISRGSQFGLLAALILLATWLRKPGWRPALTAGFLLLGNAWLVSRLGQRGLYIYPLMVALGLVHYLRRRVPVWVFVALMFAGLVISNVQLQWRTANYTVDPDSQMSQGVARPLDTLAFHEGERQRLSTLAVVFHEFPDRRDHLLGETYLGLVATFMPRWLWPEKESHFQWRDTMIMSRLVGAPFPTPYLGVLWVNWSWPGIVLGMLLWGVFLRAIYEARQRNPDDPGTNLMYLATLVFFGPTLLAVSAAVQYVLPAYVCLRFIGWRRGHRNRARPIPRS